MKKSSFITFVASALVVAFTFATSAEAQIQNPQVTAYAKTSLRLSKGTYQTVSLSGAPGVTSTVTGTVSGTVASLTASGSFFMATVTSTITSTISKKTISAGKIGNKELLQLIFNTTNSKTFRGYSPVWVTVQSPLLDSGATYIGARKGKETNILIRPNAFPEQGVLAKANYYELFESATPNKKDPNQLKRSGYGYASIEVNGPINAAFTKSSFTNVDSLYLWSRQGAKFSETIFVSPTGTITNSTGASLQ